MQTKSEKQPRGKGGGIGSWLAVPQPRLGIGGVIALLLLTGLATPLALDMYTPAIPLMVGALGASEMLVNLTLVGFFAASSIGLLLFGTVSDKLGRKPVLLAGCIVYASASFGCAAIDTVEALIALRVAAALGSGAMGAVGTAIIKDSIVPEHREKLISTIQVMFVIGPVLSPVIGALLLQFTSWRGIFVAMAVYGAAAVVLACLYRETLPAHERSIDGIMRTMGHLGTVLRNRGFALFLLATALLNLPFMAYISVGSYIYEEFFGLSELAYSGFFAIAAIVGAFGPILYLAASKRIGLKAITTGIFAFSLAMGVALLAIGWMSPVAFCIFFSAFGLAEAMVRPYSMNVLLDQQEGDTGAASSLMNFANVLLGSIGMLIAVLPWPTFIIGVGVIMSATALVCLAVWAYILRKPVIVKGINDK